MSSSFCLSAVEFDAYLAERATSNAYSRPRIEVKQRALGWARGVASRLAELGIAVDVHATGEHPSLRNHKRVDCQWIFFWRDERARDELERLLDQRRTISAAIDDPSPYTRHAFLGLRIDARAVEVCFAVHSEAGVDVDNLRARLAANEFAAEFTAAMRALPMEFQVGVGVDDRAACGDVTLETISTMLDRVAGGRGPLWIGWHVPRETVVLHADTIGAELEDALVALGPIYRLAAWSRDNDHVALEARLAGAREERARTQAERTAENERWQKQREAELQASRERARARNAVEPPRGPVRTTLLRGSPKPSGSVKRGGVVERPEAADATPEASAFPGGGGIAASGDGASTAQPSSSGALDKGSRVRVCAGPFADKLGVVSELDGRGGARVLLGLLSTRLDLRDLEAVPPGRERPSLQSSHRHPVAPARKAR